MCEAQTITSADEAVALICDTRTLAAIDVIAETRRRSRTEVVTEVLTQWAEKQIKEAALILGYLDKSKDTSQQPPKLKEKDYEVALAGECVARGMNVLSQVRTGKGDADLVIGGCVIEVKLNLRGWRDIHRAVGQARAYAKALGLSHTMVCAPDMPQEFKTADDYCIVCDVSEAADLIASIGG